MSLRTRIQAGAAFGAAAAVVASLATIAPVASAQPVVTMRDTTTSASSSTSPARVAALRPATKAGQAAGRKAGAAAGAKAGRAAGAKAGGARGAKAGEAAGRKAGALAGAKAGRKAGAKLSSSLGVKAGTKAGTKAGRKVGRKAGAKAGAAAGHRAGKAAAANTPNCGVNTYRKPDGTPWKCTFADNFSGDSLDTRLWRVMTSDEFAFGVRKDCFMNSPKNVSVSGGVLNLVARRESSPVSCARGRGTFVTPYSSGMVSTYQKWEQAFGRFEFRAKFPYTEERGVQTSLWLWPADASGAVWPITGEIDVAEWYSQWPDRVIPFLHYVGLNDSKATNKECYVDRVQDWHTYLLEWYPGTIRISYDGQTCLLNDTLSSPFDKPFFMAMFGGFGLARNAPTAATPAVNRSQFAWVRAWS
ncbi:glycoside hydrolase family 16 protein [Nocardioides marmoriginsengisoli]|uniref:Glycoside hydrolase family 16 protein n=1 Tax=Nocardioides marmoriginsengisoli TaxID=661483 RepID=A0A3N0CPD5_9ACTN|nr:glycoside hydrolase family 16 protein [Nocardioides marmoriginsengisoli]RNL65189.1 glycoside hydrolase family 16 protein [Nocardioides marmoriginsengisoli]